MGTDQEPTPGRLPARMSPLPTRGPGRPGGSALPVRTTRTRPPGRHRSPHQLSVPSDAPALVLAVPGRLTAASADVATGIIEVASQSCPGVTVRAGFLAGGEETLQDALADCQGPDDRPAAV